MRMIQRRRKSRFLVLRSRVANRSACITVWAIAFHSLERPPRYPLASSRIRLRRRRALTPRFALGIGRSFHSRRRDPHARDLWPLTVESWEAVSTTGRRRRQVSPTPPALDGEWLLVGEDFLDVLGILGRQQGGAAQVALVV